MGPAELKQLIGRVSHESIKHWLKISSLPHTAGNEVELCRLLNKLTSQGKLPIEQLKRLVLEIEEHGEKRVYLGTVDSGIMSTRSQFKRHVESMGLELTDQPVKARHLPAKPTVNYALWSEREVRIGYSETHESIRVSRTKMTIEAVPTTNLIIISTEPETGFTTIFMDTPGDRNPHQPSFGGNESYSSFYKQRTIELLGATEFKPIDLLGAAEKVVNVKPRIFEPLELQMITSHNSRVRMTSRSDVRDDPVYIGGEEADGDRWVHENLSGYWLPEASENRLHRRLFMQLSRREDMIRFAADCLAREVEYAISRIRKT